MISMASSSSRNSSAAILLMILTVAWSFPMSPLSAAPRPLVNSITSALSLSSSSSSSHDSSFDMSELSRRIQGIQTAEKILGNDAIVYLPVIAMEAILPQQRLRGRTSDRTFGRLLAGLGLGGLFAVVSMNHAQRKLRRNGVICRIELCDAPASGNSANGRAMTAVDYQIVGLRRCRLVGPPSGMKARIGRWRRMYCPDGEGSKLGFGVERFVDVEETLASVADDDSMDKEEDVTGLPHKKWTNIPVDCDLEDQDRDSPDAVLARAMEKAETIIPLLDQWQKLASDVKTYENTDVVAGARVMTGRPWLRVDPAALLRKVRKDIGEQPSTNEPTQLALWGAALINPLPPLGVAPEIRGRVLEAPDAMERLVLLEWALKRSIANLEGKTPLI